MSDDANLFEPVGLSAADERVYQAVLDAPGSTAAELAAARGVPPARLARPLARLERLGLVGRSSGTPRRWSATMPEAAVEILVSRRMEQLQRLRLETGELMERFRASARPAAGRARRGDRGRGGVRTALRADPGDGRRRDADVRPPPYVQAGGNPGSARSWNAASAGARSTRRSPCRCRAPRTPSWSCAPSARRPASSTACR
ncbi:helix-turn-helix domain-containing protein [Actinomadura yumaensis]|uniref:helix-turn-helix domain-containing protein n=1 Tax=Actinomadura yumaensis TaxID=111807 RepID=UPI003621F63C